MSTLIKRYIPLVMLIMLMTNVINVFAQRPEYVYDEFDILTDAEEKEINDFLYEVDVQLDGAEVVFVIEDYLLSPNEVDDLGNPIEYPTIFDMALDYFENVKLSGKTGIGKAGKDNGVLVIMTLKTGDYYLMTGYGVEGDITDAEAGRILDNLIGHLDEWEDYQGIKDCAEEIADELGYEVEEPVVITPNPSNIIIVTEEEPPVISESTLSGWIINIAVVCVALGLLFIPVTSGYDDEKHIWEARF